VTQQAAFLAPHLWKMANSFDVSWHFFLHCTKVQKTNIGFQACIVQETPFYVMHSDENSELNWISFHIRVFFFREAAANRIGIMFSRAGSHNFSIVKKKSSKKGCPKKVNFV